MKAEVFPPDASHKAKRSRLANRPNEAGCLDGRENGA